VVEVSEQPSRLVGHPVVEIVIDPTGDVRVVFIGEKLFAREFVALGAVVPQQCVPSVALHDASVAIGRACFEKGMMGVKGVRGMVGGGKCCN
jgi:hypothetical protein